VNYNRPQASSEATGETDVLAQAWWEDGTSVVISVENKVWASPQTNQGSRHRAFVEEIDVAHKAALIAAPSAWLNSHGTEVAAYHGTVELEAIAAWFSESNYRDGAWKASLFQQAVAQTGGGLPAEDLDHWCAQFEAKVLGPHGIELFKIRRQRTRQEGQARPNRFLRCADPTLSQLDGCTATLRIKPRSTGFGARVDIEITDADEQLIDAVSASANRAGLVVRPQRSGTLIVTRQVRAADAMSMARPFETQEEAALPLGLAAAAQQQWWNNFVRELTDSS
jgi:hypothetical protein